MTLAVMTRASLGHTGHDLVASIPTQLIYLAALIAALARVAAAFVPWVCCSTLPRSPGSLLSPVSPRYGPLLIRHPPNWAKG